MACKKSQSTCFISSFSRGIHFRKEKSKKKNFGASKMRFLAKICPKNDFFAHFCTFCAHFCIILTECNVVPVVGHGRQVYDMISDIFFFKNGQKRPKTVKNGKNDQKRPKNGQKCDFFFFFFACFFPIVQTFHLLQLKTVKNSPKWSKMAKNSQKRHF